MENKLRKILEKQIFTPLVFRSLESDIKKIEKHIKYRNFKIGEVIDFDNMPEIKLPLFFVFEGSCSIIYKGEVICEMLLPYSFTLGEISYMKAVGQDDTINRLGSVLVEENLKSVIFDMAFFEQFPINIKIFLAEKIFRNLTEKIVVSNQTLEKYKICSYLIRNFFKISKNSKGLYKLKSEIKSIVNLKRKAETFKKTMNQDFDNIIVSDKASVKKRYLFLKKNVIPYIEPLKFLPDNLIFQIAQKGIWLKYNRGDNLIHQGEVSDGSFYIIFNGTVEILFNNIKINELSGAFMVGEMTLLKYTGVPSNIHLRTSTVRASELTYAIKVDSKILKAYNSENKLYFYNSVISQLLKRIAGVNESLLKTTNEIKKFLENLHKSKQISEMEFEELQKLIFSFPVK